MTQRRRRAPQTARQRQSAAVTAGQPVPLPTPAESQEMVRQGRSGLPIWPDGETEEVPEIVHPRIRFVRFRFGWGYEDTAPAIVFDEQIAVLLPPKTPIAKGAQLTFRAPDGGWSIGTARPGDGIGEYQEV